VTGAEGFEGAGWLCDLAREAFVAPLLYSVWPRLVEQDLAGEALSWGSIRGAGSAGREGLRPLYYANAARKAALLQLLEETAAALEGAGIEFLLLKGAALEVGLELPPALRVMADLDLLVAEGALAAAEQALAGAGLAPTRDAANALLLRERGYHAAPYAAEHGGAVELHRRVLPRSAPFRLMAADLWRECREVRWRGQSLRVPSAEHLFLHTVIHSGFWHTRGAALRRVWDLSLLVAGLPLERSVLMAAAERCGVRRLTEAALWEADTLHTEDAGEWAELGRRLRASDDLWTPHSSFGRLRARGRGLDHFGQRLSLWRYAVLPAREETANATGCGSGAAHLIHFLHPRRVWRGVGAVLTREGRQ
jgi:hypothetical protein